MFEQSGVSDNERLPTIELLSDPLLMPTTKPWALITGPPDIPFSTSPENVQRFSTEKGNFSLGYVEEVPLVAIIGS